VLHSDEALRTLGLISVRVQDDTSSHASRELVGVLQQRIFNIYCESLLDGLFLVQLQTQAQNLKNTEGLYAYSSPSPLMESLAWIFAVFMNEI